MSAAMMMLLSTVWRCAIAILPDVTGNAAHDMLGGFLGRSGEWMLLLAAALAAWAVYAHQRHLASAALAAGDIPRRRPSRRRRPISVPGAIHMMYQPAASPRGRRLSTALRRVRIRRTDGGRRGGGRGAV